MESVDDSVRRAFTSEQFKSSEDGLYQSHLAIIESLSELIGNERPSVDFLRLAYGLHLERRFFFELGKALGYFEGSAEFRTLDLSSDQVAAYSFGAGSWPDWFARMAGRLDSPMSFAFEEPLSSAETNAVSLFQAALLLAEDFNDPQVYYLQRALQDDQSCLDEAQPVSSKELWDEIRRTKHSLDIFQRIDKPARCLAGFMQLVQILEAFECLFVPRPNLQDDPAEEPRPLERGIFNILKWRLNLDDERTRSRLSVVSREFWNICEAEFRTHSASGIDWSPDDSQARYTQLLDNWASRSDPDKELKGPSNTPPGGPEGRFPVPRTIEFRRPAKSSATDQPFADAPFVL